MTSPRRTFGLYCRQCQGDLIGDGDRLRCGTCGLPVQESAPAVKPQPPAQKQLEPKRSDKPQKPGR